MGLIEETKASQIQVQCRFSKAWNVDKDINKFVSVGLDDAILPLLREAATTLKDEEVQTLTLVRGKVVGLSSKHKPDDYLQAEGREVTISFVGPDEKEQRIHVPLSPEDYMYALRAHVQGVDLSVLGTVRRIGRQLRMDRAVRHNDGSIGTILIE